VRAVPRSSPDAGAAAVEFALVLPLLMMFLFGIIQYGMGLYQYQAFSSAVGDASRLVATGVVSCAGLDSTLDDLAQGSGLDPAKVSAVTVVWLKPDGSPAPIAQRLGLAQVSATYQPFDLGVPFVPFPDTFTGQRTVTVQDIASSALTGCP
jgi:TadE-like protein